MHRRREGKAGPAYKELASVRGGVGQSYDCLEFQERVL